MELAKIFLTLAVKGEEEAEKELDKVSGNAEKASGKIGKALGKVGAVVGKATIAAVGAAATGLTALTKSALGAAGELEQNMGGAEAVFKGYADKMVAHAESAYKLMGLSQSDYLATANKMGALFQGSGFGIDESANMAAEAMQRAADVASIMGIDVSSAMEAVAGAAKGNFTMMDNLGVAINDTTLEIYAQEHGLGELNTTQDKVAAAMQMFMEKTEYAAGNYAKENDTLSGSLTTLSAAWQNWLSGSGDTSQLANAVLNAADVIIGSLTEILPRLTTGIGDLINKLAPKIPTLIQTLLPSIITAITTLISSFAQMLPEILTIILPVLIETAPTIINTIVTALIENLPILIEGALQLILALANGITQALPQLVPAVIQTVVQIVVILLENVGLLVDAAGQLIDGLALGLLNALVSYAVQLGEWANQNLVQPFLDKASEFINIGKTIVDKIKTGISNAWASFKEWFKGIWDGLFGNLNVNVGVSGSNNTGAAPGAAGFDYVPYNNFPALLHEGEAVLTASEADAWRKGKGGAGNGVTIIQNITAVAQTPVQLASATAAYFEQARWAL